MKFIITVKREEDYPLVKDSVTTTYTTINVEYYPEKYQMLITSKEKPPILKLLEKRDIIVVEEKTSIVENISKTIERLYLDKNIFSKEGRLMTKDIITSIFKANGFSTCEILFHDKSVFISYIDTDNKLKSFIYDCNKRQICF
ncbi:MAG: hypothetical protein [Caudoviricetes sp.]|nr:MAG: hypothetical protein [Caudoviricetes sp.]